VALPALLLPEHFVDRNLAGVDPAALERFGAEWRGLCQTTRERRPADGTKEEDEALAAIVKLSLDALLLMGSRFADILRESVNAALQELLRKELVAAEPERKFALRQIEQAANTFGVLIESVAPSLASLPVLDVAEIERVRAEGIALSAEDRIFARFQLDLAVALDSLDAPLQELTYWAFRAVTGSRRVQALPLPGARGELARIRSRNAWRNWDAEEIRQELAPWPPAQSR